MTSFLAGKVWRGGCVVLAGLLVLAGIHIDRLSGRLDQARQQTEQERTSHQLTKANYTSAQRTAEALATQHKTTVEARDAGRQERIDRETQSELVLALDAAALHAATHRVRRAVETGTSAEGAAGAGDLPAPAAPAQGADGPGGDAELVAISAKDLKRCTENSIRLAGGHIWALEGIAQP